MRQVTRAVALNDKGEILLVRHGPGNKWALPGGHIEEGENPYQAIKRELKEEFDLDIEILGEKDGIAFGRPEIEEFPKPISIYSVEYYSNKINVNVKKLEYIFLIKLSQGVIKVQETEIYDYNFFTKDAIYSSASDIFPQIVYLIKKYVK